MALITEDPLNPGFGIVSNDAITEDPLNPGFGVINAFETSYQDHPINLYTQGWLEGQEVFLADTRYGFTLGEVTSASYNHQQGTINVSCISRLGDLNDYNIQAQPFVGRLEDAFRYYCELGGVTVDVSVDATIADRHVEIPGWRGDLWYHLKQLAAAQECEVALVAGVILFRPVRVREAEKGYTIQRSADVGGGQLAQAVEVYWYQTREITNELVYPPNGWHPEVEVLNVNAGETAEYTLEMDASLSSIVEPTMETFVAQYHDSTSVYTVVADDGLPVPPAMWTDHGGRVEITLNSDTRTLDVKLTGANNIPLANGGYSRTFSLALASDTSGSRYSTLRIVGTGVAYHRTKKTIRTGLTPTQTSTEVGVTIDNPFLTSMDAVYAAGTRAATQFSGNAPSLSGSVAAINRRGESDLPTISYGQVQGLLEAELGADPTYPEVQAYYTSLGLTTYGQIKAHWDAYEDDTFERQAFGNVNGARVWDQFSRRWYRIRSGTIKASSIDFSLAEDDLTYGDMQEAREGMTYAEVTALNAGLTYQQERLAGIRA